MCFNTTINPNHLFVGIFACVAILSGSALLLTDFSAGGSISLANACILGATYIMSLHAAVFFLFLLS